VASVWRRCKTVTTREGFIDPTNTIKNLHPEAPLSYLRFPLVSTLAPSTLGIMIPRVS
jgi:hypothetical protein